MSRKFILAAVLLALTGVMASAQLKLGVKAGFTSSNTSLKEIDTKAVNAYHIGGVAQLDLPLGFALQSGVLYQVKGVNLDDDSINISTSGITIPKFIDKKYQFLEIPAQLQWGLDLMFVRPFVLGEYYWGYSLNEDNAKEHGYAYGFGIDITRLQISAKYFKNHDKMKGLQLSVALFF